MSEMRETIERTAASFRDTFGRLDSYEFRVAPKVHAEIVDELRDGGYPPADRLMVFHFPVVSDNRVPADRIYFRATR